MRSDRNEHALTFLNSIEDEGALKAKVDEALAVYDEYVKAQGPEGGEAKKEDAPKA